MNTIRVWVKNARAIALPQSLLPAFLAVCMASQREGFSILLGLLAVLGVAAGHLGLNLFDDYFDYKVKTSDYRKQMQHQGMRARISKCDYLTSGAATLKQLLVACFVFGAIALFAGLVIYLFRGQVILILALIAGIIGLSYSGAPLRLSYRGLGEIVIGIMFGPMLMSGVFYAACGVFDRSVLFVSIPVGLLVANIVYTHAIMDYEPDKAVGKMTFAVLLKNKRLMLGCLALLLVLAFGLIVSGVVSGYLSPYYLLSLLTLPMAVSLFYLMIQFIRNPERTFTPRFWMGPMGNWKGMQAAGVGWFMVRWLQARNLLAFFCLILMVVSLVGSL
jgi:1,4-dihydroxy-2-naphthoate octaprenyltransferase